MGEKKKKQTEKGREKEKGEAENRNTLVNFKDTIIIYHILKEHYLTVLKVSLSVVYELPSEN